MPGSDRFPMCRPDFSNDINKLCYRPDIIFPNGVWQGDNPLDLPLTKLIGQVITIVIFIQLVVLLLKPLGLPRVIAEIIGGILLGPSVLGRWKWIHKTLFAYKSMPFLETMANIGLFYFIFLTGLELDLSVFKSSDRKAQVIGICGVVVPVTVVGFFGTGDDSTFRFSLFVGVFCSLTAFPILARLLAELKLLNTELGRTAMSAASVNDMLSWSLLVLAVCLKEYPIIHGLHRIQTFLETAAFFSVCVFVIRPLIRSIAGRTPEGQNFSDIFLCFILTGVLPSAYLGNVISRHSVLAILLYGSIIPNGRLRAALIRRFKDFVIGLLLPLYFAIIGLETNIDCIIQGSMWQALLIVWVLAYAAKVAVTVLLTTYFRMPFRDGFVIGLLINTKGLVEMILLKIGKDRDYLDDESFGVLVFLAIATTSIITPVVILIFKPHRSFVPYKRRTIQKLKQDSELRLLACFHTSRNVPTMINFLEVSHPTKKSPTFLYALHLVELTERATCMDIAHNAQMSSEMAKSHSDHIIKAFEKYTQHADGVSFQPLSTISTYSSMHEDICNIAEDKCVSFIILPFHKQQTVDGNMESPHRAYRSINQNVLANAPCSVGVLVDRGLNGSKRVGVGNISHHLVVLFFGGADDREALSYAMRMAYQSDVSLTVVRFVLGEETAEKLVSCSGSSKEKNVLTVVTDTEKERQKDDDYIFRYQMKTGHNTSMVYAEIVVNNGDDTMKAIRSIGNNYDLYIVGRGQSVSQLTAGLTDWIECPELGGIGDLLASSDFGLTASVLVVQQFAGVGVHDGLSTPDSQGSQNNLYAVMYNAGLSTPNHDRDRGT